MAVDVQIANGPVWTTSAYSVVEDATPIDPSSTTAGFGQFSVITAEVPNDKSLIGQSIQITDGAQGVTLGFITALSAVDGNLTITANGQLGILNATLPAAPFTGNISAMLTYYLGLVGITTGFAIDAALTPATRTNLLKNPSGRRGVATYALYGAGTIGQDLGQDTLWAITSSVAAGAGGIILETMTIGGGKLVSGHKYVFTADLFGATVSPVLDVVGAGVVGGEVTSSTVPLGAWTRVSITFTATSSGSVVVRMTNPVSVTSGTNMFFRDAILEDATTAGTSYFDGYLTTTPFAQTSWATVPDNSVSTLSAVVLALPGFFDNIWTRMKSICSGLQIEMVFVSDEIQLRPIRSNIAQTYRNSATSWNLDNNNIAQNVSIFYYQSIYGTFNAYPLGGVSLVDNYPSILQVDANQSIVTTIPLTPQNSDGTGLGASLVSVEQPVAVDGMPMSGSSTSAYSITGQDNNPYPAAQWVANGGSVTVAISEDSQSLIVTVNGCNDSALSPFRLELATDSSQQTFYSTLFIVGTGTFYDKKIMSLSTGNGPLQTATVDNGTIDNFSISDVGTARSALLAAMRTAMGPTQSLTVSTEGVNTSGASGNFTFPTFGDFDAVYGGHPFSLFDGVYGGGTYAPVDAWLFSLVRNEFANQAFGNVNGARVYDDYAWYRISEATITDSSIEYTALYDTTFGDWDAVFGGKTFSVIDAPIAGKTFQAIAARPLATS